MSVDNLPERHSHKHALSRGWIRSALRGNLLCVGRSYRDDQVFFDVAAVALGEDCASLGCLPRSVFSLCTKVRR
jgi:hypothetical protein